MEYIYLKTNWKRKKLFQMNTGIAIHDGKKIVVKQAIYPEGIENVQRIYDITKKLKHIYKNKYTEVILNDDKIESVFWDETMSFGEKLYQLIISDNWYEVKQQLLLWKNLIRGSQDNICSFTSSYKFEKVFGYYLELEGCEATYLSNVDCTSENILFNRTTNEIKIIDYEWTFPFKIPVEFILFYGISLFCERYNLICNQNKLIEMAQIDQNNLSIYERMKNSFHNYIFIDDDSNIDYRKMGNFFLKPNYNIIDLAIKQKYKFTLDEIPINSKIVIYGAGNVGSELYSYCKFSSNYEIVGWVDKKAESYRKKQRNVNDLDDLQYMKFDYIIVGVFSEEMFLNIKQELIFRGIDIEKIRWIDIKLNNNMG